MTENKRNRASLFLYSISLCFLLLGARAVQLYTAADKTTDQLNKIYDRQNTKQIVVPSFRGSITDRKNRAMAITSSATSLYINPKQFDPDNSDLRFIARKLKMKRNKVKKIAKKNAYFSWLARRIPERLADEIISRKIRGLFRLYEPKRIYPLGKFASNLIGYVGIDGEGLFGVERQYSKALSGPTRKISLERDALGRKIFTDPDEARPELRGKSLSLTIDASIQQIAFEELQKGVKNANAKAGTTIVLDVKTGEILATVSYPSFDPNRGISSLKGTRHTSFQDLVEPGSVAKGIVIAAAMDQDLVGLDTKFDCENGVYKAGSVTFRDSHKPESQFLTVKEIIATSSNVCTYKIARLLGRDRTEKALREFGVGSEYNKIGFPAHSSGSIMPWKKWREIRFANISFGQGFLMSPLEIASAYQILANDGKLVPPRLLKKFVVDGHEEFYRPELNESVKIISQKSALSIRKALVEVVENGAIKAKPMHHSAAGKTGTSQKVDPETGKYSRVLHRALFVGFSPAINPKIVVLSIIDEPQGPHHYGAIWAAPVFSATVSKTLDYLGVPRDRTPEKVAQRAK